MTDLLSQPRQISVPLKPLILALVDKMRGGDKIALPSDVDADADADVVD